MATELKPAAGLSLTSLNGGVKRGPCLQLTAPFHKDKAPGHLCHLELRKDQAVELAHALLEFALGTRPEEG